MVGFRIKRTNGYSYSDGGLHIYPLTNFSSFNIQRGEFKSLCGDDRCESDFLDYGSVYEPPSIELYTYFSLQTYFFAMWGLLFLQSLTIFIIDKILVKTIPKTASIWERFIHACQKSHLPFPYTNWYKTKGGCQDHVIQKKAVDQEVILATIVNLIFNMLLLAPLGILCKFILL